MTGGERRAVLLTVAYDGSPYAGFALQPARPTVAGELLAALRHIDPGIARLRAASRTDAGVHAEEQRVAFDTARDIPSRGWVLGTNRRLPSSIAIQSAASVASGFDPRRETMLKSYRYVLSCDPVRHPFLAGRVWQVGRMDDEETLGRMRAELRTAIGTHRFDAFRSSEDRRHCTTRSIARTAVVRLGTSQSLIALDVTGDGFLHRMVRILVGTAVDVGRGRLEPGAIARALQSGRRTDAGVTAPPDGLLLRRVWLRSDGSDRWPPGSGDGLPTDGLSSE